MTHGSEWDMEIMTTLGWKCYTRLRPCVICFVVWQNNTYNILLYKTDILSWEFCLQDGGVSDSFTYKMAAMQNKQNVNKNNVEYILCLHLVRVTWPLHGHLGWHYNDYRLPLVIVMTTGRPPTRSAFDNAQRHVTAFRPISEAVRSWSCDIGLSDVGAQLAG